MPEIQMPSSSFTSHGVQIFLTHYIDWLTIVLLIIAGAFVKFMEPFHRYVGANMMTDLSYPFKPSSVPFWAVIVMAIPLPITIFLAFYYFSKNLYDLHRATLGLLFGVLVTGLLTDAIKNAVGRPRPDFFWRCFSNGVGVYDSINHNVVCNGIKGVIKDGYKSFPSGHTSVSFAGTGFLAWYLEGKFKVCDRRGHIGKVCTVSLPLLVATFVGVSRVDDYKHHWEDVFFGGVLGISFVLMWVLLVSFGSFL